MPLGATRSWPLGGGGGVTGPDTGPTLQGDLKEVVGILLEALFGLARAGGGPAVAVLVLLADGGQEVVVQEVGGRGQAEVPVEGRQQQQLRAQELLLGEAEVLAAQDPRTVYLLQLGHVVFLVLEFTCGRSRGHWTTALACTQEFSKGPPSSAWTVPAERIENQKASLPSEYEHRHWTCQTWAQIPKPPLPAV